MPRLALIVLSLAGLFLVACEKPDASYVTSPSLKTLIGTTTGNTAFNAPEMAPGPVEPPANWEVNFDLARWARLENEHPSLEILMQVRTHPGTGFELWLTHEGKTVARWSAGSTNSYTGTVCFQLELQKDGEAVPLGDGKHEATIVFRDPEGAPVAAQRLTVTNTTPKLEGAVPAQSSDLFREALACRRGQ